MGNTYKNLLSKLLYLVCSMQPYVELYINHAKYATGVKLFFSLINALHPSQQQWSCWDAASILWDFYPTLGCHDTQNVLHKYSHPSKPIRLIFMDGLTKPLFLGRLRLEQLTSNLMVSQKLCLETKAAILFLPNGRGPIFPLDHPPGVKYGPILGVSSSHRLT